MSRNIEDRYYIYLTDKISDDSHDPHDYSRLLRLLYITEFYAVIENDNNRISDAFQMRIEYENREGCYNELNDPVSVLEVMVALAVRCEESIMGDQDIGDRTSEWFWYMIYSMGLLEENDYEFDYVYAMDCILRMINRTYDRNGVGSLFYIPGCTLNMRTTEIWYQMNRWLETI